MEVNDRALKESGSCPQFGRQKVRSNIVGPNRSTTFLIKGSEPRCIMKRFRGGGGGQRTFRNPGPADSLIPSLEVKGKQVVRNLCQPFGDGFDPTPLRTEARCPSAAASSSFETVVEEGKRHIDVIVRIRPKNPNEEGTRTIVWKTSGKTLIFDPKEKEADFFYKGKRQLVRNGFGKKRPNKNLVFAFDHVFGQDSTNIEIFENSLKPLVDKVVSGYNCTVFAYGATGSGKTYTMLGSNDTPGITVLMAEELFRQLRELEEEEQGEYEHDVRVSYLEVYNETIKDLLNPTGDLQLREDGRQGIRIPSLTVHKPKSPADLLRLLRTGNSARSQHPTDYNSESSRSHAVFEITLLLHQHDPNEPFKQRTATSRLFMVDLAGSEKGSLTADGMRLREGANINRSLLALSNCINALADGKAHIPYRNSKLTRLLKDSLSGNCVTVMIANVSPSSITFEDTHNTLHYANRAKNIKVTCKQVELSEELVDGEATRNKITDLQNEVQILAQELAEEKRKHRETKEKKAVDKIPQEVDQLLHLLEEKKERVSTLTEQSLKVRLHEWDINCGKMVLDMADALGRPPVQDPHFVSFTRLMNGQSDLLSRHTFLETQEEAAERKLKSLNVSIEKALQMVHNIFPPGSNPLIPVSLDELLQHKELEAEVKLLEGLVKLHGRREHLLLNQLKKAEAHRIQLLRFGQEFVPLAFSTDSSGTIYKKWEKLVSPVYDPSIQLPFLSRRGVDLQVNFDKIQKSFQSCPIALPSNDRLVRIASKVCSDLPEVQSSEILPTTVPSSPTRLGQETSAKDTAVSCLEFHAPAKRPKKQAVTECEETEAFRNTDDEEDLFLDLGSSEAEELSSIPRNGNDAIRPVLLRSGRATTDLTQDGHGQVSQMTVMQRRVPKAVKANRSPFHLLQSSGDGTSTSSFHSEES